MPEIPFPPPIRNLKRRRHGHALLNKHQAQELNKAKKICAAALNGKHRDALQARGISENFLAGLASKIELCLQKSSEAMQQTILKENYTTAEGLAKKTLLKAVTEIQAAAKQKYARTKPVMLADYCIGKDLDANRAALEQYSQNILERLGGNWRGDPSPCTGSAPLVSADTLPGITLEKVAALGALRAKWIEAHSNQTNSQALATGLRAERDALVQAVTDKRIQIQFAAEAEWPASDPASASRRPAFLLQPSRPFSLAA